MGGAVKSMQCGHAFLIHPPTHRFPCKGETFNLERQAWIISNEELLNRGQGVRLPKKNSPVLSGEYKGFDRSIVDGLPLLIERIEKARFPRPSGSVTNMCRNMCPSKARMMKEGFAW